MSTGEASSATRGLWIGLALGWTVMLYGIGGVLVDAAATRPIELATWVVGANLVHDVLIAPAAFLVGAAVVRVVPPGLRAPVQAGLGATAVVLMVGYAPLRSLGRRPDNPTIQPLDYGTAVLTVLAVVWAGAAAWAITRARRRA